MGNRAGILAAVVWCCLGGITARADETALDSREARLVELARTFPVIDTAAGDCPDFDLRCRSVLDEGVLQLEVRHRKGRQLEILATHAVDDTPILAWSNRNQRLVAFAPRGPEAWLIENIDLNLQFCGTPHRYFHPEFRFCFEEHEKTSVVIDVPSMLLTSPGKLCDDGTGRTVTRISVADSTGNRRLVATESRNGSTRQISLKSWEAKALHSSVSVELVLSPTTEGVLVETPSQEKIEAEIAVRSRQMNRRSVNDCLEIASLTNELGRDHILPLFEEPAKSAGRESTIKLEELETARKAKGSALRALLIRRPPRTDQERVERARVEELARRLPSLDTRQPDCPPFLIRLRMRSETGAEEEWLIHHRGKNELDCTIVLVDDFLPSVVAIGDRLLAIDPVEQQLMLFDQIKMQFTYVPNSAMGAPMTAQISGRPSDEQFALIDLKSVALKGCETLKDRDSSDQIIRLAMQTLRGRTVEIDYHPSESPSKCRVRFVSDDSSRADAELTILPPAGFTVGHIPPKEVLQQHASIYAGPKSQIASLEGVLLVAVDILQAATQCLFGNQATTDPEARAIYESLSSSKPDWQIVRRNQLAFGSKLRELLEIPRPVPTADDLPVIPAMAADEITPPR